jgi:hypothetical protein
VVQTVVMGFTGQATNLTTAMTSFSNDLNAISVRFCDGVSVVCYSSVRFVFFSALQNLQTVVAGPFGFETYAKGNLTNFQTHYPSSTDATSASSLLQNLIDGNFNDSSPASQTGLNDLALRLASIQSDIQVWRTCS